MTILRRSDAHELMDSGGMPVDDVARALRFLARVNRWFGGYRLIVDCFEDWSKDWPSGAQRTVRLFFMHFWAYGDAITLAKGLKAALGAEGRK